MPVAPHLTLLSSVYLPTPPKPSKLHSRIYKHSSDGVGIGFFDTGTATTLTPNASDFVGHILPTAVDTLNGLTSSTTAAGEGKVEWTVCDALGTTRTIQTKALYVPSATIRLFSPQSYFQENASGSLRLDSTGVQFTLFDDMKLEYPTTKGTTC